MASHRVAICGPLCAGERSFLSNPRAPQAMLLARTTTHVRVCGALGGGSGEACTSVERNVSGGAQGVSSAQMVLPRGLSISQLRARLGPLASSPQGKVLDLDDVRDVIGGFESTKELVSYHEELQVVHSLRPSSLTLAPSPSLPHPRSLTLAPSPSLLRPALSPSLSRLPLALSYTDTDAPERAQALLSSWCCTSDTRFKRFAGIVPYLLPPLGGQRVWRGTARLRWAALAIADMFTEAGDADLAAELRPSCDESGRRVLRKLQRRGVCT